jgi:hypothetical protein
MNGPPDPFARSLAAAAKRADPHSIDHPGTSLAFQTTVLQFAGQGLTVNYRGLYEQGEHGWAQLVFYTEGLYQQLHAAATTASVLVGQTASPPLKVGSLTRLLGKLDKNPQHPLNESRQARRRELGLLAWLCDVRNVALQHRAENAYTGNRGIVIQDGFALLRTVEPVEPAALRKARDLFRGMCNKYGAWNETPNTNREALTYLDLGSHELFDLAPADFDTCRRVVANARCFDLVVSLPLLENADAALAALIEMAPPRVGAPSRTTSISAN